MNYNFLTEDLKRKPDLHYMNLIDTWFVKCPTIFNHFSLNIIINNSAVFVFQSELGLTLDSLWEKVEKKTKKKTDNHMLFSCEHLGKE